jgi:hypothetical protein
LGFAPAALYINAEIDAHRREKKPVTGSEAK